NEIHRFGALPAAAGHDRADQAIDIRTGERDVKRPASPIGHILFGHLDLRLDELKQFETDAIGQQQMRLVGRTKLSAEDPGVSWVALSAAARSRGPMMWVAPNTSPYQSMAAKMSGTVSPT
ncbi:MAG TPA: hypothetical protein VGD75_13255, partial [Bradyrhizobium sp.]